MNKKHSYMICLIIFFPLFSFGQRDYFSTFTSTYVGVHLIDGGATQNAQKCQMMKGDQVIEYSPYQVKKYGFNDGRTYVSKKINLAGEDTSKRVFLEQLYEGESTLYLYKAKGLKTFFIEKDSTYLVELQKNNEKDISYTQQLLNITEDCAEISNICKLVSYNKRSLSQFMKIYNQCDFTRFIRTRFGIITGYARDKLIPVKEQNQDLSHFDYNYDNGFTIGIFMDKPISASNYSLHTAVQYLKNGYSYNEFTENKDIDFVANLTSLKAPLFIRYISSSNKIRPYLNAGLIGTYIFKNETFLYETRITQDIIEINDTPIGSLIHDFYMGYGIGGGLEIELNYKYSLFIELRYENPFEAEGTQFLGTSGFEILTGIIL